MSGDRSNFRIAGLKDEKLKAQYLKDHIASVRNHLFGPKGLNKKNYNKLYGLKSLQSVIVFFPATSLSYLRDAEFYILLARESKWVQSFLCGRNMSTVWISCVEQTNFFVSMK